MIIEIIVLKKIENTKLLASLLLFRDNKTITASSTMILAFLMTIAADAALLDMLLGVPMGKTTLLGLVYQKFDGWLKKRPDTMYDGIPVSIGGENNPALTAKIKRCMQAMGNLKTGSKKLKGDLRKKTCIEFSSLIRDLAASVASKRRSPHDMANDVIRKLDSIPAQTRSFDKNVYNGIPIRKDVLLSACNGNPEITALLHARTKPTHITTNFTEKESFKLSMHHVQIVSFYSKTYDTDDAAITAFGRGAKKGLYAGFKVIVDGTDTRPDRVFWHITVTAPKFCDKFVGKLASFDDVHHTGISFNAFPVLECLLDKKTSTPSVAFDFDGVLATTENVGKDAGFKWIRDPDVVGNPLVTKYTDLAMAAAHSLDKIQVVTNRRIMDGSTKAAMASAANANFTSQFTTIHSYIKTPPLDFSFQEVNTKGDASLKAKSKIDRITSDIACFFEDDLAIVNTMTSVFTGLVGHYDFHDNTVVTKRPKGKKTTVIGFRAPIACGKSSVICSVASMLQDSGKTVEIMSTDEINSSAKLSGKRVNAYSIIEATSYVSDADYLIVDTGFTSGSDPVWVDKIFSFTANNDLDILAYSLTGILLRKDHPTIKIPDELMTAISTVVSRMADSDDEYKV